MSDTCSDFLIERLHAWGVRRIYGYPGDGINGIMGALGRVEKNSHRIEFVQSRHEEMAAFMACGHTKFTGEVGVCLATSGPGALTKARACGKPLRRGAVTQKNSNGSIFATGPKIGSTREGEVMKTTEHDLRGKKTAIPATGGFEQDNCPSKQALSAEESGHCEDIQAQH